MGNAFSDVIGAGCASTVEDLVRRIGIPLPNLTKKQALSFKVAYIPHLMTLNPKP